MGRGRGGGKGGWERRVSVRSVKELKGQLRVTNCSVIICV